MKQQQLWKIGRVMLKLLLLIILVDGLMIGCYYFSAKNWMERNDNCDQSYETGLVFFHSLDEKEEKLSGESTQRLERALTLFKQQKIKQIIVAGGNRSHREMAGSEHMALWLEHNGIPKAAIFIDACSYDTGSNLLYAWKIVQQEQFKSVLCITSAYHLFRIKQILPSVPQQIGYCASTTNFGFLTSASMFQKEIIVLALFKILPSAQYRQFVHYFRTVDLSGCD